MSGDPVRPQGVSDEVMRHFDRWNDVATMGRRIKHGYLGIPWEQRRPICDEFEKSAAAYRALYEAALTPLACCPLAPTVIEEAIGDYGRSRLSAGRVGLPTFSHRPHTWLHEGVTVYCSGEKWQPEEEVM